MARKSGGVLVFMYGTLKRHQHNAHFLSMRELGCAQLVAEGRTKHLFPLIVSSRFNLPFLLDQQGVGKHVEGEVYDVDESMLDWLDEFEDCPDVYTRRQIQIILSRQEDPQEVDCWVYMLSKFPPQLVDCKEHIQSFQSAKHAHLYTLEDDDVAADNVYEGLLKEVTDVEKSKS